MSDRNSRRARVSCKKTIKKLKKSSRRRRKNVRIQALGHRKRAAVKNMARRLKDGIGQLFN